jgi:large subunit ribosomal protein L10
LFSQIKASRTMAPAKGGETSVHDIEVKSGETQFKPGPIVGELQKVGIPAAIMEGKVVIKTDKVIVQAGKKIPADIAQMLTRLEIYPIEIGMTLYGVFEEGSVFKPDILDINIDEFIIRFKFASTSAFNLAVETGWATKQTIQPLIIKAHRNAFALAIDRGIVTKDTIKNLLSKAHANMLAIKNIAK